MGWEATHPHHHIQELAGARVFIMRNRPFYQMTSIV